MKMNYRRSAAVFCFLVSCFVSWKLPAADLYYFLKEIHVGGEGGWDYLTVDGAGRRLYASHNTKVIVIDVDKDELAGQITGTPGVHGFAIAPTLHRGFSSNGRENNVSVVDLQTLKTIQKVATGANPDAILFESGRQEVYAFNGRGQSATVIDAASGMVTATVPLSGKPEFAAADAAAHRVYCNLEDKNEITAIDTRSHKVVNSWPIAPGKEASGMAIDAGHHRLFIGCHNKLMEMIDSANGTVLATVPIGTGVDANVFDPAAGLAFASCGDGTTTIAREDGDKLTVAQILQTRRGARTLALDPATRKIYLATADYESQADKPEEQPQRRPRMIANTFKIIVYGTVKPAP